MFIIKHKTRRKTGRAHTKNAEFFFTLYGADGEAAYSNDNVHEVADALEEVLKASKARKALTLWDVYPVLKYGKR